MKIKFLDQGNKTNPCLDSNICQTATPWLCSSICLSDCLTASVFYLSKNWKSNLLKHFVYYITISLKVSLYIWNCFHSQTVPCMKLVIWYLSVCLFICVICHSKKMLFGQNFISWFNFIFFRSCYITNKNNSKTKFNLQKLTKLYKKMNIFFSPI